MLDHDLENTPLRIKTDTDTGLVGSEEIWIQLFDSTNGGIGEIVIYLRKNPLFQIRGCMSSYDNLPARLPTDINKEWAILKQPGPALIVQCNNEAILDFLLSSSTCDEPTWHFSWNKKVVKIMFSYDDSASDSYEFTALAGNIYLSTEDELAFASYLIDHKFCELTVSY